MSHGDADKVSSYKMAVEMKEALERHGANVTFQTIAGGGHCCWQEIYRNADSIEWLLSHTRNSNSGTSANYNTWGRIKAAHLPVDD